MQGDKVVENLTWKLLDLDVQSFQSLEKGSLMTRMSEACDSLVYVI